LGRKGGRGPVAEANSPEWPEFQRPGVYLVYGLTEEGEERLYVGKGENVGSRVQAHPEKQPFEVTRLLLFSSKDENLNASQVGWLESSLIQSVKAAKRIVLTNANSPKLPSLSKAEHATVSEFFEDVELIAVTPGFDIFEQPRSEFPHAPSGHPTFHYALSSGEIAARLAISDEGYVVLEGSQAGATTSDSLSPGYAKMRKQLIDQGVLVPGPASPHRLVFSKDHVFAAPSPRGLHDFGISEFRELEMENGRGYGAWDLSRNPDRVARAMAAVRWIDLISLPSTASRWIL